MNFRSGTIAIALAALAAQSLGAQSIADRVAGRVSPELAALVQELGSAAQARGLPVDPLIQKAIEGSAKGIAPERVASAVRLVAAQLDTANVALQAVRPAVADTIAIAAGAFALTAGLNGRQISELARAARGAERADLAAALRVAGTLAALGVPPAQSVELVSATLRSDSAPGDLLSLPTRLQGEIARGTPPAQAAAGLARAAAAQARRGPPPGHGRPRP